MKAVCSGHQCLRIAGHVQQQLCWVTKGAGFLDGSCAALPSGLCVAVIAATILPCTLSTLGYSCLSVPILAHSIPAISVTCTILAMLISCLSLLPLLSSLRNSPGTAHLGGSRAKSPSASRRAQIPPMPCAFHWDIPASLAP